MLKMTLIFLFVDGKEAISLKFFWRCLYTMSFREQFRVAHNTGGSNAMTVTLNENFVLFRVDSHLKSDSTFDFNYFASKVLYLYM